MPHGHDSARRASRGSKPAKTDREVQKRFDRILDAPRGVLTKEQVVKQQEEPKKLRPQTRPLLVRDKRVEMLICEVQFPANDENVLTFYNRETKQHVSCDATNGMAVYDRSDGQVVLDHEHGFVHYKLNRGDKVLVPPYKSCQRPKVPYYVVQQDYEGILAAISA